MKKGKNYLLVGETFMWVITVYSKEKITMFEFNTENEAREACENIQGYKILSEVVYFNDHYVA
jgi:ArsR family metal-binding transcriptional regulator